MFVQNKVWQKSVTKGKNEIFLPRGIDSVAILGILFKGEV